MKLIECDKNSKVVVICKKCLRALNLSRMFADLDGKPFEDYYCDECVKKLK